MTSTIPALAFGAAAGLFAVPVLIQQTQAPSTPPAQFQESLGSSADVSLTGCIVQGPTRETFILRDAKKNPADLGERGSDYVLVPVTVLYLESHLTHIVRVSGEIGKAGDGPTAPEDLVAPRLIAKGLAMAAGTCAEEYADTRGMSVSGSPDSWGSGSGGRIGFADLASNGMAGLGMGALGTSSHTGSSSRAVPRSSGLAYFGGLAHVTSLSTGSGPAQINSVTTAVQSEFAQTGTSGGSGWSGASWYDPTGSMPGYLPGFQVDLTADTVGPMIAINSAAAWTGVAVADAHGMPSSTVIDAASIVNPEPATLVLLGTGLLLVARAGRQRLLSQRRQLH